MSLSNCNASVYRDVSVVLFPPPQSCVRGVLHVPSRTMRTGKCGSADSSYNVQTALPGVVPAVNGIMLILARNQSVTAGNLGGKWPSLQCYYIHYPPIV